MSWPTVKISELCEILDNKRKPITKKNRIEGPYPYYGATGVLDYVEGYLFDEDLVLIGEDGAKWGSGDNSAFAITGKTWVNNHAHVVKPFRDKILDSWLIYFLNGEDLSDFITGMTVPKLNQGKLKEIPVPLPSIPEQKRIVSVLDTVFADLEQTRAKTEQNLKNARELFDSYLQQVFSQKGEGWVETTLGDILHISSSKRVYATDWTNSGVPFFGGKEIVKLAQYGTVVSNAYISEEKYMDYASKYDMPQKDDILMTARGTIGVGYIVKEGDKFYYKDGNIISLRQKKPTNPHFILYAFKSHKITDQIKSLTGTTVNHLPLNKAKELNINTPSYQMQNELAYKIKRVEENVQHLIDIYEEKLNSIDELKKSILQKAFSGELTNTVE